MSVCFCLLSRISLSRKWNTELESTRCITNLMANSLVLVCILHVKTKRRLQHFCLKILSLEYWIIFLTITSLPLALLLSTKAPSGGLNLWNHWRDESSKGLDKQNCKLWDHRLFLLFKAMFNLVTYPSQDEHTKYVMHCLSSLKAAAAKAAWLRK